MVVQFYAEIKGEYKIEITNLTSKRMRLQVAQQFDDTKKGRKSQLKNRSQFFKDI